MTYEATIGWLAAIDLDLISGSQGLWIGNISEENAATLLDRQLIEYSVFDREFYVLSSYGEGVLKAAKAVSMMIG